MDAFAVSEPPAQQSNELNEDFSWEIKLSCLVNQTMPRLIVKSKLKNDTGF
jgi:hypothetical protein